MVYFPHEETGKVRMLSRPWHGPYRVKSVDDPEVTVSKVYFVQDGQIQVHQSRVKSCPPHFSHGFYWYGSQRRKPGRPPKWTSPEEPKEEQQELTGLEDEILDTPQDEEELTSYESTEAALNYTHQEQETQLPCHYPLRSHARDRALPQGRE